MAPSSHRVVNAARILSGQPPSGAPPLGRRGFLSFSRREINNGFRVELAVAPTFGRTEPCERRCGSGDSRGRLHANCTGPQVVAYFARSPALAPVRHGVFETKRPCAHTVSVPDNNRLLEISARANNPSAPEGLSLCTWYGRSWRSAQT